MELLNLEKQDIDFNIYKIMTDFRVLFRNNFYTDDIINYIINSLHEMFDTFSIEYIKESLTIQLKIKKTSTRKYLNYSHTSSYYYNRTLDLFKNIFISNEDTIKNMIINQGYDQDKTNFMIDHLSLLYSFSCQLIYNIITISDNIVNICL